MFLIYNFITNILEEIIYFFNEISVYLLLGFFIAGILHIIFPRSIVKKHLGHNTFGSVIKSTLFGIPLPLCSCGVVPVAASLRKSGASKGASISFLIATPQIGADSFMITYSLLGWIFGLFRIIASFITAIVAGIIVNIIGGHDKEYSQGQSPGTIKKENIIKRAKTIINYVEYELLGSIANSLLIGIVIAGIISAFIPEEFFEKYLGHGFLSMLLMLAVGIPMYICAAASTPIAASLILKGISPGAALVFLLTGPATNAITISTVLKTLGKRATVVYLASISIVSLALGYLLNIITEKFGFNKIILLHQQSMLPKWLKISGSIILISMLVWYYLKVKIINKIKEKKVMNKEKTNLNVNGMTCIHCVNTVKKAVESVSGTSNVFVDLDGKRVEFDIKDNIDIESIKKAIENEGYDVNDGL
ncbi:MAG: permease [Spirochaetes bacterium]|nr:permease [Spirochaetota bacterium]